MYYYDRPGGNYIYLNIISRDLSILIHIQNIEPLKGLSGTYCLECVSNIMSILSIIFHTIYGTVCIKLTNFSYDDCENTCIYLIIIIKSEVRFFFASS